MEKSEDKVKKFNEKRVFIFVGLAILILSLTIFRRIIANTLNLVAENRLRREKLASLTKKVSYLDDLDANELEKRVRQLEQVFPSKKPSLEFLNSLRSLAQEDKVTLGGFKLESRPEEDLSDSGEKTEEENKLQDFQVQFDAIGTLTNISKFVRDLERTAPLTKIENLDLSLKAYASESSILKVGLQVRSYYQVPPKSIPAVESPVVHLTEKEEKVLDELVSFKLYPLKVSPGVTLGKENLFK